MKKQRKIVILPLILALDWISAHCLYLLSLPFPGIPKKKRFVLLYGIEKYRSLCNTSNFILPIPSKRRISKYQTFYKLTSGKGFNIFLKNINSSFCDNSYKLRHSYISKFYFQLPGYRVILFPPFKIDSILKKEINRTFCFPLFHKRA